jgi:hypothetical protein
MSIRMDIYIYIHVYIYTYLYIYIHTLDAISPKTQNDVISRLARQQRCRGWSNKSPALTGSVGLARLRCGYVERGM